MVYRHRAGVGKGRRRRGPGRHFRLQRAVVIRFCWEPLAHARSLAALALHHLVALLQQALALAILALLLLLDVGAFFIGHASLPATRCAGITMMQARIPVYKRAQLI